MMIRDFYPKVTVVRGAFGYVETQSGSRWKARSAKC